MWLSQKPLTDLFGKAKGTISEHIKHISEDGELEEISVVRFSEHCRRHRDTFRGGDGGWVTSSRAFPLFASYFLVIAWEAIKMKSHATHCAAIRTLDDPVDDLGADARGGAGDECGDRVGAAAWRGAVPGIGGPDEPARHGGAVATGLVFVAGEAAARWQVDTRPRCDLAPFVRGQGRGLAGMRPRSLSFSRVDRSGSQHHDGL